MRNNNKQTKNDQMMQSRWLAATVYNYALLMTVEIEVGAHFVLIKNRFSAYPFI